MNDDIIVDQRQVELAGAERATVELNVRSASLWVGGGADELIDATFEYTDPGRRPIIDVDRDDGDVEVEIEQPKRSGQIPERRNRWDIALNSTVPTELNASVASGNAKYELANVNLTSLDIESSSGSTNLVLAGRYPALDDIAINGASGSIALDLSGQFEVLDRVDLETASGSLSVDLTGEYHTLSKCTFNSSSGKVRLDLDGDWRHNSNLRVNVTSGTVTIDTPGEIGVVVIARTTSGRINQSGFAMVNGELRNDLAGVSDITMRIVVNVTSGNVRIT